MSLDYALSCLRRAAEHGYPWSVNPSEAAALIAEVEMLRAEAKIRRNLNDGLAAEVGTERAAVVAWLRHGRWVEQSVHLRREHGTLVPAAIHDAADAIERGEHRRKEE